MLVLSMHGHASAWSEQDKISHKYAYIYLDEENSMQQVLGLPERNWIQVSKFSSHGFKSGEYWLRIASTNLTPVLKKRIIRMGYALHDYVDIYQFDKEGNLVYQWHLGDADVYPEKPIRERNASFPLDIPANESLTSYIRIKSINAMNLGLDILDKDAHGLLIQISILIAGLVYGVLLVMAIYNFGIAIFTGDKAYFVYVAYVVGFVFFALSLTGDGFYFLWNESPQFNAYSIPISAGLLVFPTLFFLYYLLDVKKNAPSIGKFFKLFSVITLLFLSLIMVLPITALLKLINILSIVVSIFVLSVGVYLFIKKVPIALIYVIAWIIPLLGFAILSMSALGIIPSNSFTQNASILGGVVETIILSLALAYRIKLERIQKEAAMESALQSENQAAVDRLMYQELFDHAPVGIFRYTMAGKLVAVNPVLARMVGFSSVEEVFQHTDKTREMFSENSDLWKDIVSQKKIIDREVVVMTAKNEEKEFSISMHAHGNNADGTIEGYLTDISERKIAQHRHELMEKERMSSMEQLVTGVAHEINTPLGTNVTSLSYLSNLMDEIQGKLEAGTLTISDFKNFLKDGGYAVNIMSENLTTMSGLVSRFKLVSVKQMNIEKATMHMEEYFNSLINSYKEQYPSVDIKVNTHEIKEVQSYPAAWTIIIEQLIENSVAHGFSEEQVDKSISMEINREGDTHTFTYRDNGKGLPIGMKEVIFDPFSTSNRGSSMNAGLGMYRVYNLVQEALKGELDLLDDTGFALRITISR